MDTETIRPGPITLGSQNGVDPPNFDPTTAIVGGGSQWADGLDATHAVIGSARVGASAAFDIAWGTVPAITFDPEAVSNLVVRLRAKVDTVPGAPGPAITIGVRSLESPGAYDELSLWNFLTPGFSFDTTTDLVRDYSETFDHSTLLTITQLFTVDREVAVQPVLLPADGGDTSLYQSTVYEVSLEFTFGEVAGEPAGLYLYDGEAGLLLPFNSPTSIPTT